MFYQIYCPYKQYITYLGPYRWGIREQTVKLIVGNCTRCWTGEAKDALSPTATERGISSVLNLGHRFA